MSRPRRRYTEADRAAALELYVAEGPTAVQERFGVPKGTVVGWARAAGVETEVGERTRASIEVQRVAWEERRVRLAHEMGAVAELALRRARGELTGTAAASARAAKDAATAMAILVDKAQLLTGGATGRHEVSDPRQRLAGIRDELVSRRSRRGAA